MIRRQERLSGVNPELVKVVLLAASICPIDIWVIEGLRTVERQRQLVAEGKSKTMNSRHITGNAVDLWDGKSWDKKDFKPIIDAMEEAGRRLGVKLTGGYTWGWDYPHWQIEKS
ncbi:M15 family metallopeptidase [Escherichia coli]